MVLGPRRAWASLRSGPLLARQPQHPQRLGKLFFSIFLI